MAIISFISLRSFGSEMASVGIRHLNLAHELARDGHRVRMFARPPYPSKNILGDLEFHPYLKSDSETSRLLSESGVVIADMRMSLADHPELKDTVLVTDIPHLPVYEVLEAPGGSNDWTLELDSLREKLAQSDFILCSNPRQKAALEGGLLALGRHNVENYGVGRNFAHMIGVAPFGIPSARFAAAGGGLKGRLPGVNEGDVVGLWNGAMHSWFDPELVIRALDRVHGAEPRLKLVFPSPYVYPGRSGHPAGESAAALARELGLYGESAIFLDRWVPYTEWLDMLADADFGIFAQRPCAETYYASRIRSLDLTWRGIPVIQTEGDYFGEFVRDKGLGAVSPAGDEEALAKSLSRAVDPAWREEAGRNAARERPRLTWTEAAKPLLEFCAAPKRAADRVSGRIHPLSHDGGIELSHVRDVIIYGTGAGGEAAWRLASGLGWRVTGAVDGDPSRQGGTFHGLAVQDPGSLAGIKHDLVIVGSITHAAAIAQRLIPMGLRHGRDFIHLADRVTVTRQAAW